MEQTDIAATDVQLEPIVRAAASGDQQAWDELVRRYSRLVWAVARTHRLSSADAADVSQTTWLRLVEHIGHLREPGAVGAWLATTARREALRILRYSARCDPREEVPEPDTADTPELDADLLSAERDALLWRAFSRLPARDQALLRMLTTDPAPSYNEVSAATGMPIGSIGPTRARALERLRREMEQLELLAVASA
jgi:RNA polymerase sigma factor (sigma-70 family)